MTRITRKDLDQACRVLNTRAGFADTPLWRRVEDRNVATIGMFYVEGAYGGWALYQMVNDGGGVRDVFRNGFAPARELYGLMRAYMTAQEDAEQAIRDGVTA